ncbi:hypothetical protein NCAS_0A10330 [Naumovozyma castellii]|uniref:type I protein arginine methyltransferase n=1 Tax=Naumovozyma castellii TaxID=27288 RepID=G0V7Z3_NAUCA|nr:hypothetical protein NCAS_0A10330 [Naumovozyma castellii CBS 4309]CCC67591.1 hypothetical protein NCAS_0A10330 [Naumovozyma castellii CBS 4309]
MSKTTIEESATKINTLNNYEKDYFESYNNYGIHEEMLQDEVRTQSYRNAIKDCKHLFQGKIVLDVGCGTGILSMFAARNGAKHVIGVDMSSIIEKAQELVDLNGFSHKITLLRGKLEDIELPFEKVDIIISEWMGYFLLFESMLDTVLYARDKYLVDGGLIFPDKCSLHIAGIEDNEYKHEKTSFWENVYGFDYSPFIPLVMREPIVDIIDKNKVNTTANEIIEFDLNIVKLEDLTFEVPFHLKAKRNDTISGLVTWFDVVFPCPKKDVIPVSFSTGPFSAYTHWKQTLFYLQDDLECEVDDDLEGTLSCSPSKVNNRDLDIKIKYTFSAKGAIANIRSTKSENTYLLH